MRNNYQSCVSDGPKKPISVQGLESFIDGLNQLAYFLLALILRAIFPATRFFIPDELNSVTD